MLTRIKIYFQLLVNQSVSKTSETTNTMIFTETKILVHFYKKFQDIIIIFHDFPGRVVTLSKANGRRTRLWCQFQVPANRHRFCQHLLPVTVRTCPICCRILVGNKSCDLSTVFVYRCDRCVSTSVSK